MTPRTIVAMGGAPIVPLVRYALGLRGRRLLFVGTASGDDAARTLLIYEQLSGVADVSHAAFFPWPPMDLAERVLASDVVLVGGGNTANMLAIWRVHGVDTLLREAWERGVVLAGWSAGAICWFEAGVTDSFGPELTGMTDGLGFLAGSACPHYDGEEQRRPAYTRLVSEHGFPAGIAIDDGVAVRFDGTEVAEVVTCRDGATAYRVGPDGEVPLQARLLEP